ncbi:MAG TPA: DEAD/DEAH box helicase family protein, partial [Candidatus Gracilibacteria bacterium]|nr:DEAD/DEAH box helicase family protein [Candidatus Gracilibacteria bacterium]
MERGRLINVVERRRQADVQGKSIPVRTEIIRVAKAVTEILRGTGAEITGPRDVFEICMELDRITVAPEIQELFRVARREVLATIFEELANEKNGTIGRGDVDKVREREAQRNLWRATSKLMNSLNELQPDSFGPQWIREKLPEIYVEITAAIRNPLNETLEWEKLIETLPQAFQSRFTSKKKLEKVRGAEDDIEIYRSVAEALGSEALAEFLSLLKGGRNFGHRLNIVRRYLGKSAPAHFTYRKFAELPAAAIENPDFRKLVAVRLRNKLYSDMLTEGDDLDKEKAKLGQIRSEAFGYIDGVRTAHVELLDEVVGRFRSALEIKSPQRLVSKVADKDGSIHSFPSLRQRFAMSQIDRNNGGSGKLLVSFFMGKGKTATAFLTKEHVGAKRMLFTCPKPDLVTQTAARVPKYYRKGQEPEIGTIQAGMSQEAIAEELKKEVVIVPFTMFSSKLNGGTLVDALKKENFDMMVVDEAHNARNEDGHYSRSIKELAYGIRGLYDKGYIMLLSGDPVPNTPDDIAAHLGIADREKFAEVESLAAALKRVDPLKLRNALLDFMLILDPPEQWQEYVEALPLELSKEESVIYDSVIEDESLPAHEKVRRLRMAILNPAMVDASFAGTGTMADSIAERMIEDFEGESVTLFAEPSYKLGVFRPDPKQEEVPTMVDHVKETLKQDCLFLQCTSDLTPAAISKFAEEAAKKKKIPVMLAIYDGDTRKRERDTIKDISKNVGEMGVKMVIFAMAGTIREGIDLSHINRAYLLAPEFNQPDVAQFVKRFRREGNDRAQIGVFIAPGTVLEGIHLHAQQKAILCDALKYGNVVSQVELGMVDDSDGEVKLNQGGVVFGTHFAGALLSPQARLRSTLHFLKGKNASEYQEFIDADGEKYAKLYARYWEFSDSAQVGRLTSAVLSDLIAKGLMDKTATIADVASGPMVLANTLGARQGGVTIHSYDMNQHMLTEGALLKAKR